MRAFAGLAALAALGLAPAAAGAATISYSQFYPGNNNPDPGQTPQSFSPIDWDGTAQGVSLPQFDPALGTLRSVDLSLYGGITATGTLHNTGASAADISGYSATVDIALLAPSTATGADGTPGGTLVTVSPMLFTIATPITLQPGQSYAFDGGAPVTDTDSASALAPDAAPYVGTGSLLFPLLATTSPNFQGAVKIAQNTAARAEATITYTFDAVVPVGVPEPASPALLGAGLLCLGLLRRRP